MIYGFTPTFFLCFFGQISYFISDSIIFYSNIVDKDDSNNFIAIPFYCIALMLTSIGIVMGEKSFIQLN